MSRPWNRRAVRRRIATAVIAVSLVPYALLVTLGANPDRAGLLACGLGIVVLGLLTARRLERSITRAALPHESDAETLLRITRLNDELTEANRRLQQLARTDGLTGLMNQRRFFEQLEQDCARVVRLGTPLALLLVDIDHFKHVNDRFGHLAGDAVLREIARRIAESVRRTDCVARYGGEEFALLLPGTGHEGASITAEKVRRLVSSAPVQADGHPIEVTVSIGVCVAPPGVSADPQRLFRWADEALYLAKRSGRDRVKSSDEIPRLTRQDPSVV